MSADVLRELAARADGVEGRPTTRVREVHARIGAARRRRAVGAVLAAVVAVVLAISATSAVLAMRDTAPHPVRQPRSLPVPPTPGPEDPAIAAPHRQLVWARGSVVHVGQRRIDVDDEVVGIAGTDDGAVFTRMKDERRASCSTTYKCGDLWFTDGTESFVIGHAFGSVIRGWQVDVSASGSTVVWFEPSPKGTDVREAGMWVAYDTHLRREVARFGSIESEVLGVYDDAVYFSPTPHVGCLEYSRYQGGCRRYAAVARVDVATGRTSVLPAGAMTDDQRHRPRTFVHDNEPGAVPPVVYSTTEYLAHDGDRMVFEPNKGDVVALRTTASRRPIELRLPAGYPDPAGTEGFAVMMWLDDDRFTVAADFRPEVLSCRVSAGRCRVVLTGRTTYGFGGRG